MMPQEHISWLIDQKDSVLSVKAVREKNLAANRLLPTIMDLPHGHFSYDVVRRDLSCNRKVLQPVILEELRKAIEISTDQETDGWCEVCLGQRMRTIINTVIGRLLYDLPLCEDQSFLNSVEPFSSWMDSGAFVARTLATTFFCWVTQSHTYLSSFEIVIKKPSRGQDMCI